MAYRVNGIYRRGTSADNPIEAEKVVERVFAHAERGQRSIGVVAFSEAQASLIEEALRRDVRYAATRASPACSVTIDSARSSSKTLRMCKAMSAT